MQPRSYHVLMIAPTSFFADYGCHVRILEEARTLQKLGQHVTIVTYHNGKPVPGLDIRRTLPIPWRRNYEVGSSRHKIGLDALLGLKTLEVLARGQFDVIHAHLHEGALIGRVAGQLFNIPVLFDFQGSMTEEMVDHHFLSRSSLLYRPLLRLEKWLDRSCHSILTSTVRSQNLLCEQVGCDPERVGCLPDCVDTGAFKPAAEHDPAALRALRDRLGIPAGHRLIVYLGLLAEYQGVGLLLQAMARLRRRHSDVHLLLMGFPNEPLYKQRAAELGIAPAVTFTGRVPYEQAPIHLALGDVAAAPKLSLTEGAGKLLDYMAVGLPVVAFDTPVAREYLGFEGLLAAPGDVDSLARQLENVLYPAPGMDLVYRQIGQRLRQRAIQHFSWDAAGQQIIQTYRNMTEPFPARTARKTKWAATRK